MSWEPEQGTAPATPAAPPATFEQLQQAQSAYSAEEAREREQLENQLEATEDQTRREMTGWMGDVLPWIVGGGIGGIVLGIFTRTRRNKK
jgi:hypothetical protein